MGEEPYDGSLFVIDLDGDEDAPEADADEGYATNLDADMWYCVVERNRPDDPRGRIVTGSLCPGVRIPFGPPGLYVTKDSEDARTTFLSEVDRVSALSGRDPYADAAADDPDGMDGRATYLWLALAQGEGIELEVTDVMAHYACPTPDGVSVPLLSP
jgi:hypothetical protein